MYGEEVYMLLLLLKFMYVKEFFVKFGWGILVCKFIVFGVCSLGGGFEVVYSVILFDKFDVMLFFFFKGSLYLLWLNNNNVNNNLIVEVMFSGVKVDLMLIFMIFYDEVLLCYLLCIF